MSSSGSRKRKYVERSIDGYDATDSNYTLSEAATRESHCTSIHDEFSVSSKKSKIAQESILPAYDKAAEAKVEVSNGNVFVPDPTWMYCCQLPGHLVIEPNAKGFSGNCLFDLVPLFTGRSITVGELRAKKAVRDAHDDIYGRCICQKIVWDKVEHPYIITERGFDRYHLCRRDLDARKRKRSTDEDKTKAGKHPIARDSATVIDTLDVLYEILRDFEDEMRFTDRNKLRSQPLQMWSKVEALAWYLNDTLCDWDVTVHKQYMAECINLVGTMLLTTIDVLIFKGIFTHQPPAIRNLGLVLALILQSTKRACRDELCPANENGWTYKAISLADKHSVLIDGVEGIDTHIQSLRDRQVALEATRHRNRVNRFLRQTVGSVRLPTEAELSEIVAKEGQTQFRKGTGERTCWMPDDDYDADGLRLWMRWDFRKEYRYSLAKRGRLDTSKGSSNLCVY